MTITAAAIRYTSSREHTAAVRMARVAAAGRTQAARFAREDAAEAESRMRAAAIAEGQTYSECGDWCHICSRATDHLGEHTPEQVEAWREGSGRFALGL